MAKENKKDELRSNVVSELITADNWFALVAGDKGVKMFTCTDPATLKKGIVTVMMHNQEFASVFIQAIEEYVQIMNRRELLNSINLN